MDIKNGPNQIIYLIVAALVFNCTHLHADESVKIIKIATPAPKGSIYHRVLQEVGAAWRKSLNNNSRFIIYTDGSQGNEANTVRRMRIGQLDACMLSVAGLKEIDESVTALQLMPFVFRSWGEFDYVHKRLRADIERKFLEKGFVTLFWGEGGWVQFFSTTARVTPEDYKTARIFAWAGTPAQYDLMKSLGYTPIVLELSDILAALQTGMIDVVPAAPMWALAFQFYNTTTHMLRMNYVPIVGATVITKRTWDKMTIKEKDAIRKASKIAENKLKKNRDTQDDNAIKAMQEHGLIVHETTPEIEKKWLDMMKKVWPQVRGRMVPEEMFDRVQKLLAEYRNRQENNRQAKH